MVLASMSCWFANTLNNDKIFIKRNVCVTITVRERVINIISEKLNYFQKNQFQKRGPKKAQGSTENAHWMNA